MTRSQKFGSKLASGWARIPLSGEAMKRYGFYSYLCADLALSVCLVWWRHVVGDTNNRQKKQELWFVGYGM